MPHRYYLYARKSSESEDRQILSIESQLGELRDYAHDHGLSVVQEFHESKSAKAPGRPVFGEMMKLLAKGKADGILCWKLDRLARNPVDGGALIWAFDTGVLKEIITPHRTFKKAGDDAFWMQLEFGIAKKYVDDLSDNVRRGLRTKAARGEPPAANLPLGYQRDPSSGQVIVDDERFSLIRRVFEEVLRQNLTPLEVFRHATEVWGLKTRRQAYRGDCPMGKTAYYHLLHNPFYAGLFHYAGELHQGNFKPVLTAEEFRRVQTILRRSDTIRPRTHGDLPYRGLIVCGSCGRRATGDVKINRFGSRYIYYHCARSVGTTCHEPCIEERSVESQAAAFLEKLSVPPASLSWLEQELPKLTEVESSSSITQRLALHKSLKNLDGQIANLTRLRLADHITDEEFLKERNRLTIERRAVDEALAKAQREGKPDNTIEPLRRLVSFATTAKNTFVAGPPEKKRQILQAVVSNLLVKDRKLLIEAKRPFQLVMERPRFPTMWAT